MATSVSGSFITSTAAGGYSQVETANGDGFLPEVW
jgi:hypothetical protein